MNNYNIRQNALFFSCCCIQIFCFFFLECPASSWSVLGSKNFSVISNEKQFLNILEARQVCQQCGADLVVLENEAELNLTQQLSQNISNSQNHIYIGLIFNSTGNWNWAQISSVKFTEWSAGEPKGKGQNDCTVMDSITREWMSTRCCVNKMKIKMVACSKCKLCMYGLENSIERSFLLIIHYCHFFFLLQIQLPKLIMNLLILMRNVQVVVQQIG